LSANKRPSDEKALGNVCEVSKESNIDNNLERNALKMDRTKYHQEVKSKGSTSPESNYFNKNGNEASKLLSNYNKYNLQPLKFGVTKIARDNKENMSKSDNN
jgi:hypothetical protein